jgi:hypothetical protein
MHHSVAYNVGFDSQAERLVKPRTFKAKFWHPIPGHTSLFCKQCFSIFPVTAIEGKHAVLSCGHKRRQQL